MGVVVMVKVGRARARARVVEMAMMELWGEVMRLEGEGMLCRNRIGGGCVCVCVCERAVEGRLKEKG